MTKILDWESIELAANLRPLVFPLSLPGPITPLPSGLHTLLSKLGRTTLVWLISQVMVRMKREKACESGLSIARYSIERKETSFSPNMVILLLASGGCAYLSWLSYFMGVVCTNLSPDSIF